MHACSVHHGPRLDPCGPHPSHPFVVATSRDQGLSLVPCPSQIRLTGPQRSPWWDVVGTFVLLEFLYTGRWPVRRHPRKLGGRAGTPESWALQLQPLLAAQLGRAC